MFSEYPDNDTIGRILDDIPFNVERIMTPWSKVIKVRSDENREKVKELIQEMDKERIDLIVVTNDGVSPEGTMTKNSLTEYMLTGKFPFMHLIPSDGYFVNHQTTLLQAAKKMVDLKSNENQIFFATNEKKECCGIFNYADFNKRICYFYTYGVILMLEQLCRVNIERLFDQSSQMRDEWLNSLGQKDRKKIGEWSVKNGESMLSCATLTQLLEVIAKSNGSDAEIKFLKKYADSSTALNKIRIRVAHPVKLLVKRNEILDSIRCLIKIWEGRDEISRMLKDRKICRPHHR